MQTTDIIKILCSRGNNDRLFYSKIVHFCGTDYVGSLYSCGNLRCG